MSTGSVCKKTVHATKGNLMFLVYNEPVSMLLLNTDIANNLSICAICKFLT